MRCSLPFVLAKSYSLEDVRGSRLHELAKEHIWGDVLATWPCLSES